KGGCGITTGGQPVSNGSGSRKNSGYDSRARNYGSDAGIAAGPCAARSAIKQCYRAAFAGAHGPGYRYGNSIDRNYRSGKATERISNSGRTGVYTCNNTRE